MGGDKGLPALLCTRKSKNKSPLPCSRMRFWKGSTLLVDISNWLVSFMRSDPVAGNAQYLRPRRPFSTRLFAYLDGIYSRHAFANYDITLIFIFDGDRNPIKEKVVRVSREAARKDAKRKLINIEKAGHAKAGNSTKREANLKSIYKELGHIDAIMIADVIEWSKNKRVKCFQAPFEADAQIASFLNQGIGDGVISLDSDLIPYGVTKPVLVGVDRSSREFAVMQRGIFVDDFMNHLNLLDIQILFCLCGNDNIKGVYGDGLAKMKQEVSAIKAGKKTLNSVLLHIENNKISQSAGQRNNKRRRIVRSERTGYDGYREKFKKAISIYKDHPVYIICPNDGSDTMLDVFLNGTYTVGLPMI
eukprot:g2201.t1